MVYAIENIFSRKSVRSYTYEPWEPMHFYQITKFFITFVES